MIYREIGQYKTSYSADQQIFPIRQERWLFYAIMLVLVFVLPFVASQYWLIAILIPTMALSLVALGLNIVTGYCGQLSLGSAAFMAIGGFMTYNLTTRLPWIPFPISIILAGIIAGLAGVIIGLPSMRIKGFYMIVVTLMAQFFLVWLFDNVKWFKQNNPQGEIGVPPFQIFGYFFNSPISLYFVTLSFVIVLTILAKNMMRSATGRRMMAVRDMEVAAEVMGIRVMRTKLLAFAISGFYCAVGGTLYVYCYVKLLDTRITSLDLAFEVMFMIIVGGLGTISGAFIGAAFIFLLPIWLNVVLGKYGLNPAEIQNVAKVIFGTIVVYVLIKEPKGLASIWTRIREKLRSWPFAY
jgi:branched-chain amino acid transport system permease protein